MTDEAKTPENLIAARGPAYTEREIVLPATWMERVVNGTDYGMGYRDQSECTRLITTLKWCGWEFTTSVSDPFEAVPMAPDKHLRRGVNLQCRRYTLRRHEHALLPDPNAAGYSDTDVEPLFDAIDRLQQRLADIGASDTQRQGGTEPPPETVAALEREFRHAAGEVCRQMRKLNQRTQRANPDLAPLFDAVHELTDQLADLGLSDLDAGTEPEAGTVARVEHDFRKAAGDVCRRFQRIKASGKVPEAEVATLLKGVDELADRLADMGLCDLDTADQSELVPGSVAQAEHDFRKAAGDVCRQANDINRRRPAVS